VNRSAFPAGSAVTLDGLSRNPYPIYARLQREEPVSWIESLGMWFVTRRKQVLNILLDEETFTVHSPSSLLEDTFGPMMLSRDGVEHTRLRAPFEPPFHPRALQTSCAPFIRGAAHSLIDHFSTDGHADLVTAFSDPLALATVTRVLNLPPDPQIRIWYNAFAAALSNFTRDPGTRERGLAAAREFKDFIRGHFNESEKFISGALLIIFGGLETTSAMLSNTVWALLRHPAQFAEVRRNPEMIRSAIEEALRWESPVQTCTRHVTRAASLEGVALQPGEIVQCMIGAANRDEAFFPRPAEFDITRRNAGEHLAFARGRHYCLGASLARLEGEIGLGILFDRLPGLRLDPARPSAPRGHEFRSPATLDVNWD
jgi:cytochrome P450